VGPLVDPLFVPADRPDRVEKAMKLGVDAVIVDLEDAVAPAAKAAARAALAELLAMVGPAPGCAVLVRVNGRQPDLLEADVAGLEGCWPAVAGVVVPKAESADDVRSVGARLPPGLPLLPIIESALGVEQAPAIATATPQVATLVFGPADLSAELGVVPSADGPELLYARSRVVLACALARIARPVDGPWLVLGDEAGLEASAAQSRRLGFGGKAAIHPAQLPAIRAAFAPTADEVGWARRVVAAFDAAEAGGVGAVRLDDGTFIDAPVAARARSILHGVAAKERRDA
jgi:citrate lyase subunit beta / citryl-CoA lyase